MRKFRGETRQFGGSFAAGAVHANTVHFTNITNVTNVMRPGCSNGSRAQRFPRRSDAHTKRSSNLLVYLAQGRSAGKLCDESVRTLGIAAHELSYGVGGMARGIGEMATGLVSGAVGVFSALFGKRTS